MTATSETVLLMLARQPHVRVAGGREIALNERDAALLALLAVEGPQSRVRVLSLLWSDDDEEASRNRLRQRLFNLRKACGRPIIEGQATLALANNVTHDLAGAGTLLGTQGFSSVAPLFIDWLHAERQRRFARQREALAQQVEALEGAGDLGAAVPVAEALLQHDPLSEDAHRRLMRLHYLRGDHAAALLAFDRCAELLKDEVGAQPSPETMQLLESMQRAEAPAAAPPRRHVPASVLRPPRLVGREAEWAWLATCWEGARIAVIAADGQVAPAGRLRRGASVVGARCAVGRCAPWRCAAALRAAQPPAACSHQRTAARPARRGTT